MGVRLVVPWPPSTNAIWEYGTGRVRLAKRVRVFREHVGWIVRREKPERLEGRLGARLDAYPPPGRHDLDNLPKAILDALEGRVFEDDSQVDELHVYRREPAAERHLARVVVELEVLEHRECTDVCHAIPP